MLPQREVRYLGAPGNKKEMERIGGVRKLVQVNQLHNDDFRSYVIYKPVSLILLWSFVKRAT